MKKLLVLLVLFTFAITPLETYAANNANVTVTNQNSKPVKSTCKNLISEDGTGKVIRDAYNIIRVAVPVILLAMSIKDFGGVIVSQDADAMKKATSNFFKRIVIALVILLTPTIIGFILKILGVKKCLI